MSAPSSSSAVESEVHGEAGGGGEVKDAESPYYVVKRGRLPCALALSKDTGLLAVGCSALEGNIWDGGVVLLDAETGDARGACDTLHGLTSVTFLDSGELLVGGDSGLGEILRNEEGVLRPVGFQFGHDDVVTGVWNSGRTAITSSLDCTCGVWDVGSGELQTSLDHGSAVLCCAGFGEKVLATGTQGGRVVIWDVRTSSDGKWGVSGRKTSGVPIHAVATTADGTSLCVGSDTGEVMLLDTRNLAVPLQSFSSTHIAPVHTISTIPASTSPAAPSTSTPSFLTGGDDGRFALVTTSGASTQLLARKEYIRATAAASSTTFFIASWDGIITKHKL